MMAIHRLHRRRRGRGVRARLRRAGGAGPLHRRRQRHRRPRADAAGRRHRPGRRGHRAGQLVRRHRRGGRRGPAPGRCSSTSTPTYLLIDPEQRGGRASTPHPGGDRRCTSTARSPRWRRCAALVAGTPVAAARGRRAGPGRAAGTAGRPALGRRWPPPPASTRARTSAPTATAARVLTDDASWPTGCGCSANHGSRRSTSTTDLGFNSRLDALQAVVLRAKLRRLDDWNDARRGGRRPLRRAARRRRRRSGCPRPCAGNEHVWHLYVVRARRAATRCSAGCSAAGHRRGHPLPGPAPPPGRLRRPGPPAGRFPDAERRRPRSCRCRCTRTSPRRSRSASSSWSPGPNGVLKSC